MELFKLDAMGDVYADAFVGTESNELLFVSLIVVRVIDFDNLTLSQL